MKKIAVLGSTGSIGTQALEIIEKNREEYSVSALACGKNISLLQKQIDLFLPDMVSVKEKKDAEELQKKYPKIHIVHGGEGLIEAATGSCHTVLNALMGIKGLMPTYRAILAGKDIALANKETLVAGGQLIMEKAAEKGVEILPVDSEHSAVFQCMQGNEKKSVKRIILTGSGGPFRGFSMGQLDAVTKEQALAHPNWSMGQKITIDSATLMNKGLEVIEARWLFDVALEKIDVVIHPQSIIHSMVEYEDNSVMAQMGIPDMKVPIAYALSFPKRRKNDFKSLDLIREGANLTFESPDTNTFRCLSLAYEASKKGGTYPVVMNGANEVLVQRFLEGEIGFTQIQDTIERVLNEHIPKYRLTPEMILEEDKKIREKI
ncbi:MAG TPA: 1-deoxy-D-xylulose-5-phosphate reductoisomerase [Bacillota bacterium]|nr:1-deoxy-D-xylulose-5-phosphate reductoisomerase [Bacillota bacterium]